MDQKNQPVLMITGASKGLGLALATYYGKRGYALALSARGAAELQSCEEALRAKGISVLAVAGDMSQQADVERFVSLTVERYGRIDVLINNASIFGPGPTLLLDYPLEPFKEVLLTNTLIPFLVTRQVLPIMFQANTGVIISLTSEAGHTGFGEWGAYGISKFAVEGLTETWADELDGTGVRMHMVDPGEMDTEMHAVAVPDCDYELARPEERLAVFDYLLQNASPAKNGSREEAMLFATKEEGVMDD
ncbi:SDR family NAD(P)-dependent oxidoreductase [Shouchella shacheensis]|uniref:SDR family NAD(P)-dependent oxidoreductase n=1 Tax=Shouchella shacheensis TaxID=1649580 RepID=UPI00073FC74A|nr:SDR family oxidoreductase [Shouchella shacheensis]